MIQKDDVVFRRQGLFGVVRIDVVLIIKTNVNVKVHGLKRIPKDRKEDTKDSTMVVVSILNITIGLKKIVEEVLNEEVYAIIPVVYIKMGDVRNSKVEVKGKDYSFDGIEVIVFGIKIVVKRNVGEILEEENENLENN